MSTLAVREIGIDMGHRVALHGSKCRNLHGHRYTIQAFVGGPIVEEGEETGMVQDFGFLKACMMDTIDANFDHRLCLGWNDYLIKEWFNEKAIDRMGLQLFEERWDLARGALEGISLVVIKDTPTAEMLAKLWFEMVDRQVRAKTDERAHLVKIKVWETPNCHVVYSPKQEIPRVIGETEHGDEVYASDEMKRIMGVGD